MKAHSTVILGALALVALTGLARAQQVTGISLNLPETKKGNLPEIKSCVPLMVTVKGTGQCSNLDVTFGDGARLLVLSRKGHLITFPGTFTHQYSAPGPHQVTVSAGQYSRCTGAASATVQVVGPEITGQFLFNNITPGGAVLVTGQNFGPSNGKMFLHLNYVNKFAEDVPLTVTNWGDGFAAGTIPGSGDSVSGALDQDTTIKVVASCGAASNDFKVHFTAARDVVDLAYAGGDPPNHQSPWMLCSMSSGVSDSDACQTYGHTNYPPECCNGCFASWGEAGGVGYLGSYHASGWGGGSSGSDQFFANAPLQNGWTVNATSADWTQQAFDNSCCGVSSVSVDAGQSSSNGDSTPKVGLDYKVNACGAGWFLGHIFIIGPLGVPY